MTFIGSHTVQGAAVGLLHVATALVPNTALVFAALLDPWPAEHWIGGGTAG